jgi:hypothetical protein
VKFIYSVSQRQAINPVERAMSLICRLGGSSGEEGSSRDQHVAAERNDAFPIRPGVEAKAAQLKTADILTLSER